MECHFACDRKCRSAFPAHLQQRSCCRYPSKICSSHRRSACPIDWHRLCVGHHREKSLKMRTAVLIRCQVISVVLEHRSGWTSVSGALWVPKTASPHATCEYSWIRPVGAHNHATGPDLRFRKFRSLSSGRMRAVAVRLLYLSLLRVLGWISRSPGRRRPGTPRSWCSATRFWSCAACRVPEVCLACELQR